MILKSALPVDPPTCQNLPKKKIPNEFMTDTLEDKKFVFLPKSKIILDMANISYIRVFAPHDIKLDFPELVTKRKRKTSTNWKCVIYYGSSEVHISGEEAEAFIELISPSISMLKVNTPETEEVMRSLSR